MITLRSAADWLARQRHAHAAMPAVYRRGTASVSLRAAPARTVYETHTQEGAVLEASRDDWIVRLADLVLAGALTEPDRGDQLEVLWPDGIERTYEVMPIADGRQCFSLDPHRISYRIHAREVS